VEPTDEPIRILHVDDEPDFTDAVGTFLERQDHRFTVETSTHVPDALDRLAGDGFDCVVSDFEMPDRNGIEFLQNVRELNPNLPFILFTGKGSEEIASDAISAGVTDYLQKDSGKTQFTVLANRIQNAVEKYRAEAELADRERRLNLFFEQSPLGVRTEFPTMRRLNWMEARPGVSLRGFLSKVKLSAVSFLFTRWEFYEHLCPPCSSKSRISSFPAEIDLSCITSSGLPSSLRRTRWCITLRSHTWRA